jgi:hypothetical protein
MPNEAALTTVTEILQNFDKDKMFPTFGVGGQFKGRTNHCFPLNGIESNPYCAGVACVRHSCLRYGHCHQSKCCSLDSNRPFEFVVAQ